MNNQQKLVIGALVLLLVGSGIVITFQDNLRIEVERDKTQFKVPREDMPWFWKVAGEEENRLFDGASIMNRDLSSINISKKVNNETQEVWIKRRTEYQRNPVVIDIYYFRGDVKDKELFPISHKVRVLNASGKFYRYTVDELEGTGEKRDFEDQTSWEFGNNMQVEVDEGYRWAWIGWPYGSDSLSVQYDIESDNETFNVRLFDPTWWNSTYDERYPHNDQGSGYTGLGYFGENRTGWYGTIQNGNQLYTYNDTSTGDMAVANDTTEYCWFDTENDRSNCPSQTGSASGLISYYALDRGSGDVKDYISSNYGTTSGGVSRGVTGQVNQAFDFDGTDDEVSTTYTISSSPSGFTVSGWFKTESTGGHQNIFGAKTNNELSFGWYGDTDKIEFYTHDGSLHGGRVSKSLNTNQWYHMVGTYDSSNGYKLYLDGTEVGSWTDTTWGSGSQDANIGHRNSDNYMNGKIDDVRVYNTALSSTEIQNLHSSTSSNFPTLDSAETANEAPNKPTNPNPADGATGVSVNTDLSFYYEDVDGDSMNSTFKWSNGTVIETVTGIANGTRGSTSSLSLDDFTSYTYNANVTDGSETNQSDNITFQTEDNTKPYIEILSPENKTYGDATQTVEISTSDNDAVDTIWYNYDGSNITYTGSTTETFSEGSNTLDAWANDSSGNVNQTSVTFEIDTTPPTINTVFPTNTEYHYLLNDFNYTYSDENPDSCWYSTDGGATNSSSVNAGTNFTVSSEKGKNNWTVYCNDSLGNENSDFVAFNISMPTTTKPETETTYDLLDNVTMKYNSTHFKGRDSINNTYLSLIDPLGNYKISNESITDFSDQFEDTDASEWIEDIDGDYVMDSGYYKFGYTGTDYKVKTRVKEDLVANKSEGTIRTKLNVKVDGEHTSRIIMRYQDEDNYVAAYISHYYSVIGIEEYSNGVRHYTEANKPFSTDVWYDMKFSISGDTAKVFWEGNQVVERELTEVTGSGMMGLSTDASETWYDDFSVGYPDSSQSLITDGFRNTFEYQIPDNATLGGEWTINAYTDGQFVTEKNSSTFNVAVDRPYLRDLEVLNTSDSNENDAGKQRQIRAKVIHGTPANIDTVYLNITSANGTQVKTNIEPTQIETLDSGYKYEYNYTPSQILDSEGDWNYDFWVNDTDGDEDADSSDFYVNVPSPETSRISTHKQTEQNVFNFNQDVEIKINVTDEDLNENISSVKLNITHPNGSQVVTNKEMSIKDTIEGEGALIIGNVFNTSYTFTNNITDRGSYKLDVSATDEIYTVSQSGGTTLYWAKPDYYYRQKLDLVDTFNTERKENIGLNISADDSHLSCENIFIADDEGQEANYTIREDNINGNRNCLIETYIDTSGLNEYYAYYNNSGANNNKSVEQFNISTNQTAFEKFNASDFFSSATSSQTTYPKGMAKGDPDNDGEIERVIVGQTSNESRNTHSMIMILDKDGNVEHKEKFQFRDESGFYTIDILEMESSFDGQEIIIGGWEYGGSYNYGSLYMFSYNTSGLNTIAEKSWAVSADDSEVFALDTADLQGDDTPEIATGGRDVGSDSAHTRLWEWTGTDFGLLASDSWGLGFERDRIFAESIADLDGDGTKEIIGTGTTRLDEENCEGGLMLNASIYVYNYSGGSLNRELGYTYHKEDLTEIFSSDTEDFDGDGSEELITSGNWYNCSIGNDVAEIRVWNYTQGNISLIDSKEYPAMGHSSILSVGCEDVNNDYEKEIYGTGFWNDGQTDLAFEVIENYNGGFNTLHKGYVEKSRSLRDGDYFDAMTLTDVNNDGINELTSAGRYGLTEPREMMLQTRDLMGITKTYSAEEEPKLNYPQGSITIENPTNYEYGTETNVSVSWTDEDNNFDSSIIETNFSGSAENVSGTTLSKEIGAGTYYVKTYGNDTLDLKNSTKQTFTINKATPGLNINCIDSVYPNNLTVEANETNLGDGDLIYELSRDGTGSSITFNEERGAGNYTYEYNTTGGSNYTSNSITCEAEIRKGSVNVDILFEGENNSATNDNFTIEIGKQLDVSAIINITRLSQVDGTIFDLFEDGREIGSYSNDRVEYSNSSLKIGEYYYNSTFLGNANYSSFTRDPTVTVVDTGIPRISFIPQTLDSGTYTQDYIYANVSANDSYMDKTWLDLYNSSGLQERIMRNRTQMENDTLFYNFTNLSDGQYYMNASVNDTSGQKNTTETKDIILDTTPPKIISPDDASYEYNEKLSEDFNATDDAGIDFWTVNNSKFKIDNTGILENDTIIAVGNYTLQINATDNLGLTNSTIYNVEINKTSPGLSLSTSDAIYPNNASINASEDNSGDSDLTYELFIDNQFEENGSLIEIIKHLSAGTYTAKYNTSGGENYTLNSISESFTVSKGTPSAVLTNNKSWTFTYDEQSAFISFNESNQGDSDVEYDLFRNNTDKGTNDSIATAGTYDYKLNTSGGENWTSALLDEETLQIDKATPEIDLFLNGTQGNYTLDQNQSIWLNATRVKGEIDLDLYKNGSIVDSAVNPSSYENFPIVKEYPIKAQHNESENYSEFSVSYVVKLRAITTSLSNGINKILFEPYHQNEDDVWPENQTNEKGVYNLSNQGTDPYDAYIKLNNTQEDWVLEASSDPAFFPDTTIVLNESYQRIWEDISGGENEMVWLRADLYNPDNQFNKSIIVKGENQI